MITHSRVRVTTGTSKGFDSSVGIHHQSALSSLDFILMMERATRNIRWPVNLIHHL